MQCSLRGCRAPVHAGQFKKGTWRKSGSEHIMTRHWLTSADSGMAGNTRAPGPLWLLQQCVQCKTSGTEAG